VFVHFTAWLLAVTSVFLQGATSAESAWFWGPEFDSFGIANCQFTAYLLAVHGYLPAGRIAVHIVGVDPGLSGAIAVLTPEGMLEALHDVPVLMLKVQRGTRMAYDVPGLVELLRPYAGQQCHVFIEESQPMPGQGTRSMFTVGLGYGLWLGIITALSLPYTSVRPAVWKRSMALGKDKEGARLRAQQLYPGADLRLKKHHGRAESLLIAHYGQTRNLK
jgi:crossover junction endodeoxyribonuclease RuvC